MLILNDIHLGVQRSGGTTPASQECLRDYLFGSLGEILSSSNEDCLMILGDLFDEFEVSPRDWIDTYLLLSNWSSSKRLILVAGNHDWSPKGSKVSSFEMLARVLSQEYTTVTVVGIDHAVKLPNGDYVIAHCSSQESFDARLSALLPHVNRDSKLYLHANYDNKFTLESDHSLNVGPDVASRYDQAGVTLVFAHEHQARTALGGSVVVLGNQWPSSISDCLNNATKSAHILVGGALLKVPTWARDGDTGYREVDWRDLAPHVDIGGFVRVVGEASSLEAGDATSAVAKFRAKSSALVVSSGIRVAGIAQTEALPEKFEVAKRFDVLEFIYSNLESPEQRAAVDALVKESSK